MRILIVINSLATGGAEKLILDSIPIFQKKGIQVELLLLTGSPTPFLEQLYQISNVRLHILGTSGVYNPLLIFKILAYSKRFDLIHVHLFPSLYWVAIAKMISGSRTKLIFTEHNTKNRRDTPFFKWIDRIIYHKYARIITISNEVKESLHKRMKSIISKTVLIHNGIDVQKINHATPAPREEFSFSNQDKIIIQVSSFTNQKDQPTAIRALNHLEKDVHLVLVGNGPTMIQCKELAKDLDVTERVHFLGLRIDVANLLKMSDFVLLSSHFEGLSLSCLEGMASGRPFIASDVKGLSGVVKDAGLLFPEGDHQQLAKIITTLRSDKEIYDRTASDCLNRANKYSIETMVNQHIELYSQLCQNQN